MSTRRFKTILRQQVRTTQVWDFCLLMLVSLSSYGRDVVRGERDWTTSPVHTTDQICELLSTYLI